MNEAIVTTGHLEKPNIIKLDESLNVNYDEIRIVIEPISKKNNIRKAGVLKGRIKIAPDFDEPLEEFKEYME